MAGKLTAAQLAVINRKAKPKEVDPADEERIRRFRER